MGGKPLLSRLRRSSWRRFFRLQVGRLSIRIMPLGKVFILLTIGLGFASLNTGNNLLYLVFAMNLSLILVSGVLSHSTLARLEVKRRLPETVYAGEPFAVELLVKNGKRRFPTLSLSLREDPQLAITSLGGELRSLFLLKIAPGGEQRLIYSAAAPRRGRLQLREMELFTKYPFGIIRKMIQIETADELLVFPRRLPPGRDFFQRVSWQGEFLSGFIGSGANPYGIREYRQGDPTRILHWKSSAKIGRFMVKEFESEKRQRFHIDLLLARPADAVEEAEAERLISATCGVLSELYRRGFELHFRLNGVAVQSGGRYLADYLRALALLELDRLPRQPRAAPPAGEGTRLLLHNLPAAPWEAEAVIETRHPGEGHAARP